MKRQTGFSLIELMIVVAIMGVLLAVSIPAFQTYSERTTRTTECKDVLVEMALKQEEYKGLNNSYTTDVAQLNFVADPGVASSSHRYSIAPGTIGNIVSSYVITCQRYDNTYDTDCGDLTLDNFGRKGIVNQSASSTRTAETCWR